METSRVVLQKDKGIYIIMYANPRVISQEVQGGVMCERGIFLGGVYGSLPRLRFRSTANKEH
jgi:hypothetical protein